MIFCGQCGLQLAAGTMSCPRCGTTVEDMGGNGDSLHANDYTLPSSSVQAGPIRPSMPPQPLVLRPGNQLNDYSPQDATSMMDAPIARNSYMPPAGQTMGTAQMMGSGHYPPNNLPTNTYTPQYQQTQMAYPPSASTDNGRPTLRAAGIVTIIFGLLFVLGSIVLFILQQNGMFS